MLKYGNGSCTAGNRRATPPPDPPARVGAGALRRRDRFAVRGDAAGDLAAPGRSQGGGAGGRAPERNPASVSRAPAGVRRAEGVPRRVLGRTARGAAARRRTRGEQTWKA